MSQGKPQYTEEQKKRMLKLAKLFDGGPIAMIEYMEEMEESLAKTVAQLSRSFENEVEKMKRGMPDLNEVLKSVKGQPGKDGDNYVITDRDIKTIASSVDKDTIANIAAKKVAAHIDMNKLATMAAKMIEVPIVDKVIEKTETIIKEQPIVREVLVEKETIKEIDPALMDEVEELRKAVSELKLDLAKPKNNFLGRGSGSRPIRVLKNGVEVSQNVLEINFVNATSVTTSGNVGRRVNVTDPSGGSGYTKETPTGTVDSSNTSFTVTATPVYIVADGATYFDGAGYTLSGLNVTMTNPPTQYIRSFY